MAKTKKVTFNMMATRLADTTVTPVAIDGMDDITLNVKHTLSFNDAMLFVHSIVAMCTTGASPYTPELFDMAVRIAAITRYGGVEEPKDAAKSYRVLYESSVFDNVMDAINHDQFDILIDAASEKIKYERDKNISGEAERLSQLLAKMDNMMESSMEAIKKVDSPEFIGALNALNDASMKKDAAAIRQNIVEINSVNLDE